QPKNKNTLRDRWIADIIESVRLRGFHPTRNEASDYPSACSIVAAAWRELEDGVPKNQARMRATLLELGFTPVLAGLRIQGIRTGAKALSEKTVERIWDQSTRAAKYRAAKARAKKRPR